MIEFLSQGGFAGFVWGSFGMTFGLLLLEVLQLRAERRTILTRVGRLAGLHPAGAQRGASATPGPSASNAVGPNAVEPTAIEQPPPSS